MGQSSRGRRDCGVCFFIVQVSQSLLLLGPSSFVLTHGNDRVQFCPSLCAAQLFIPCFFHFKGALADLLSTRENELWSNDVPASWFCLDFGPSRSVNATSYVLRHGGNYRADSLRNWDLQGSQDERNW